MSRLMPDREARWLRPLKRRDVLDLDLQQFSFIDNPVAAMAQLREIALAEAEARELRLHFRDQFCIDISPYLVFGLMRQNMLPILSGGRITTAVRSMLSAVGLDRFLYMSTRRNGPGDPAFIPFPIRYRRVRGKSTATDIAFQPTSVEKLSDDLVDTINSWLKMRHQPELSKEGKSYVARMVSEALDNAERHSDITGQDGDWAIAGFLSGVQGKRHVSHMVSLGIVSVGATIAESIRTCEDEQTRALIDDYVRKHSGRRYSDEVLRTVYALQDRISRFREDDTRGKGGVGLMDMVQFVNDLGADNLESNQEEFDDRPCITLISGRSCLMLRGQYRKAPTPAAGSARRLWFNSQNTLELPPDTAHVMTLVHAFPGTVIAIRFCVDAEHLEAVAAEQ